MPKGYTKLESLESSEWSDSEKGLEVVEGQSANTLAFLDDILPAPGEEIPAADAGAENPDAGAGDPAADAGAGNPLEVSRIPSYDRAQAVEEAVRLMQGRFIIPNTIGNGLAALVASHYANTDPAEGTGEKRQYNITFDYAAQCLVVDNGTGQLYSLKYDRLMDILRNEDCPAQLQQNFAYELSVRQAALNLRDMPDASVIADKLNEIGLSSSGIVFRANTNDDNTKDIIASFNNEAIAQRDVQALFAQFNIPVTRLADNAVKIGAENLRHVYARVSGLSLEDIARVQQQQEGADQLQQANRDVLHAVLEKHAEQRDKVLERIYILEGDEAQEGSIAYLKQQANDKIAGAYRRGNETSPSTSTASAEDEQVHETIDHHIGTFLDRMEELDIEIPTSEQQKIDAIKKEVSALEKSLEDDSEASVPRTSSKRKRKGKGKGPAVASSAEKDLSEQIERVNAFMAKKIELANAKAVAIREVLEQKVAEAEAEALSQLDSTEPRRTVIRENAAADLRRKDLKAKQVELDALMGDFKHRQTEYDEVYASAQALKGQAEEAEQELKKLKSTMLIAPSQDIVPVALTYGTDQSRETTISPRTGNLAAQIVKQALNDAAAKAPKDKPLFQGMDLRVYYNFENKTVEIRRNDGHDLTKKQQQDVQKSLNAELGIENITRRIHWYGEATPFKMSEPRKVALDSDVVRELVQHHGRSAASYTKDVEQTLFKQLLRNELSSRGIDNAALLDTGRKVLNLATEGVHGQFKEKNGKLRIFGKDGTVKYDDGSVGQVLSTLGIPYRKEFRLRDGNVRNSQSRVVYVEGDALVDACLARDKEGQFLFVKTGAPAEFNQAVISALKQTEAIKHQLTHGQVPEGVTFAGMGSEDLKRFVTEGEDIAKFQAIEEKLATEAQIKSDSEHARKEQAKLTELEEKRRELYKLEMDEFALEIQMRQNEKGNINSRLNSKYGVGTVVGTVTGIGLCVAGLASLNPVLVVFGLMTLWGANKMHGKYQQNTAKREVDLHRRDQLNVEIKRLEHQQAEHEQQHRKELSGEKPDQAKTTTTHPDPSHGVVDYDRDGSISSSQGSSRRNSVSKPNSSGTKAIPKEDLAEALKHMGSLTGGGNTQGKGNSSLPNKTERRVTERQVAAPVRG